MGIKIYNHSLLYQPIRQIAPDQRIAIESVLSECNNLLRNPVIIPIDPNSFDLQRTKNFHDAVDSVMGTHVRNGMPNCEACKIIITTYFFEGFMRIYESDWHQRLKRGESFSLLTVFEQIKDRLWQCITSIVKHDDIDDFQKAITFLQWLEQQLRAGNPQPAHNGPVAQAHAQGGAASAIIAEGAVQQSIIINNHMPNPADTIESIRGLLKDEHERYGVTSSTVTPPPAPEPPPREQNDASDTEQAILSDEIPQQVEDSNQRSNIELVGVQCGKTIESELLTGTIFYNISDNGNINEFKAALLLPGKNPREIVFPDNGVGRAAKYLLLYIVTQNGTYELGDVKTACELAGLKTSGSSKGNPYHVRNAMRQALKNAAGLQNIEVDRKKDNKYSTNLSFQKRGAHATNDDAVEMIAPKEDVDAFDHGLNYQKLDSSIPD